MALTDGVRAFVQPKLAGTGGWQGPLAGCQGAAASAVHFDSDGNVTLWPQCPGSEAVVERHGAGAVTEQVDVVAIDPVSPLLDGADQPLALAGLLVQGGRLLALERSEHGDLDVAGSMPIPPGAGRLVGLALRAGRGFALDHEGQVFELNPATSAWHGPWQLAEAAKAQGVQAGAWRGLCALPGGRGLLSLRVSAAGAGTTWEMWQFLLSASPSPTATMLSTASL